MSEENKALTRRWFEDLFNEGKLSVADEIVAQNHVAHDPVLTDLSTGPEADKQIMNIYHGAFPDANITIEEQIAEGDKVATRWTGRGTHQGEFMGVDPYGGVDQYHADSGRRRGTGPNWGALALDQGSQTLMDQSGPPFHAGDTLSLFE